MTERTEVWLWRIGVAAVALAILALTAWAAWAAPSDPKPTPIPEWTMSTSVKWVKATATDAKGKRRKFGAAFGAKEVVWKYCNGAARMEGGNVWTCAITDALTDMTYEFKAFDRYKRPAGGITCTHAPAGWTCAPKGATP